jgi:hypothetical protein
MQNKQLTGELLGLAYEKVGVDAWQGGLTRNSSSE